MESTKYVGMDIHEQTISIAVMNSAGKLIMESIIETKTITILQFIQGLRGDLQVTFQEGTWAAWLYRALDIPFYRTFLLQLAWIAFTTTCVDRRSQWGQNEDGVSVLSV